MTHDDLQLLIKAIESIKPDDNLIKDYVYPIALAFISALMGSLLGYWVILKRTQEETEKDKIDSTNKLLLEAADCFHNLQAIKANYVGKLTEDPAQRLGCVPPILMHHRPSNPEFSGLFYLARATSETFKNSTTKESQDNFQNIPRIKLIFENYNTALEMWKTRNELVLPIFEAIVSGSSKTAVTNISFNHMTELVGYTKIAQLIDLNEKILSFTDSILSDFMMLMTELPDAAESLISKKIMKKYGKVFKLEFSQKSKSLVLNRVPVNQDSLNKIIGTDNQNH
jgi:hypothetical protein